MLSITKENFTGSLTIEGFQGFNNITDAVATKLVLDATKFQTAKLQLSEVVQREDKDAGDGAPIAYDAISLTTQKIVTDATTAEILVKALRAGECIVEGYYKSGYHIITKVV